MRDAIYEKMRVKMLEMIRNGEVSNGYQRKMGVCEEKIIIT